MIYCANNNTLYSQAADASRDLGIDETALSRHLSGQRKTVGGYVFSRISDKNGDFKALRSWLLYSTFKIVLVTDDEPIIYQGGEKIDKHF